MRKGWTIAFGDLSDADDLTRLSAEESTILTRLQAVEMLRRMTYDGADDSARIQKVIVFTNTRRAKPCGRNGG